MFWAEGGAQSGFKLTSEQSIVTEGRLPGDPDLISGLFNPK